MRSRRPQPILLGDPGSAEQLAEVSGLVVMATAAVGFLGLAGTGLVMLAPASGRPAGYHPLALSGISVGMLAVAALGDRHPRLFTPARLVYLLPVGAVGLAVAAALAGPDFSTLVTMFFVWYASATTYLPRRAAVGLMAWVGLVHAVLLITQTGHFLPAVRWEITFIMMVAAAVFMNRLVERSWALARGEQAARSQAEQARANLEVASGQKTRFLARMSHELRTPLNAIIGFSEVLARRSFGDLNRKQAEYVGDVVDSGQHLLALVDDLLDLAKVETGRVELDVGHVDVSGLLSGSLALFKEQATRQQITLALDVAPGAGTIEGDARKLKQVMFNLLANALRFTPPNGRVTLGATRDADRVRIWVSDTGQGVSPGNQEAIFEEFRQGDVSGGGQGGTGLGLPLARRLVELHGGGLWVQSEPGRGSTFTAELPRRPRPPQTRTQASLPANKKPVRLLLGEPDSPERRVETAHLLGGGAIAMACMAIIAIAMVRIRPVPEVPYFTNAPLLLSLLVCVLCVVGFYTRPQWMGSPRVLPYLCALPVTAVSLTLATSTTSFVSGFGDIAALAYFWVAAAAFLILTDRQIIGVLLLIGIGQAVALLGGTGAVAPVARWVVVMGFVVVTGLVFRRFVNRIQALALAERMARAEVERVMAELELASRHKTEFLANMSHELRTPLNVIIGFSEVLESEAFGPLNPKQAEYVADVLGSGRHLLALINDILDLAKADAGRMELQPVDLDLEATLAAALVPFQEEAARRHIDLRLEAGPERLEADEAKLNQTLGHVLSNALKFTPDGGRISVRAERNADHVDISVTDTGRGIDPTDQQRIFDAFARGGDDTPEQGSGLGLALARRYAELHGGSLTVRSHLGTGSTFVLRLPLQRTRVEAEAPVEVT
jgi:signal transduction histidine kinase